MLTQAELKEALQYDPDTGVFTWRKSVGPNGQAGAVAGYLYKGSGYVRIQLKGASYSAHRLAWLYINGCFPPEETDHINGKRSDNRLINLSAVTKTQNLRNTKKRADNKSGVMGVCWHKTNNAWQVKINVAGKEKYLGIFKDLLSAVATRKAAEREHGYHFNHGRG